MDEIWARVGLVAGALALAGSIVLITRRRRLPSPRVFETSRLAPGVYFFSSASCSTCQKARQDVVAEVGVSGFTEVAWEDDPELFARLGIDAVPALLVIEDGGRGTLYPGGPGRALPVL